MRFDLRSSAQTNPSRIWIACAGVLLLSLTLRLIFLNQLKSSPLFSSPVGPDVSEYWAWSGSILQGKWLWDSVPLHGPLYAFVLAAERWVTSDSFFALHLLQLLQGLASQLLIGWAVWRRLGGWPAVAALMLWTLHLPLLFYDGQFYAEGLMVLLLSGVLALTIGFERPPGSVRAGFIGLLLGLAVITHPRALLFAVGVLLWLGLRAIRFKSPQPAELSHSNQKPTNAVKGGAVRNSEPRQKSRFGWTAIALAVGGLLLPIVPVSVYNSRLSGSFTLVQRHEGLNLFIGNNPKADGTPNVRVGPEWDRLVARPRLEANATTDAAARAWYQARVWEFISGSPLQWLALEARKLALTVAAQEITASAPYATLTTDVPLLRIPMLGLGLLLPFTLVGLMAGGWRLFPAVWLVSATVASSLIFVAAGRYRLEMLPPLFVFGGLGVVRIVELLRDRAARLDFKRWISIAIALLAGVVIANLPLSYDRAAEQAEGAFLRGMGWLLKQDRARAEAEFRNAVAYKPDFVNAIQILGEIIEDSGRADEGLALVRRSIELDDRWARSLDRLSAMLERRGDREGSMQYARAALKIDPLTGAARLRLANALAESGKTDEACEQFEALLSQTSQTEVLLQYANVIRRAGRHAQPAAVLQRELARQPENDQLLIRLARVLAACPDAAGRNPAVALSVAQKAVRFATDRRAEALDVLAMALAANGRFEEAAAKAGEAISAARNPQLQALFHERLLRYRAGRPYVDLDH